MKIVPMSYEFYTDFSDNGIDELARIERAARVCYKSEGSNPWNVHYSEEETKRLIRMLIRRGHMAMLEHMNFSVKLTVDRGVSHELVRHRIASYAQESTRYCNYSKDKFGNEITVIEPPFKDDEGGLRSVWYHACTAAEQSYFDMLEAGASPQIARAVLPTCLKTDIVVTANYREWRNIFALRCADAAHPQIRAIMREVLADVSRRIPVIFDDLAMQYPVAK